MAISDSEKAEFSPVLTEKQSKLKSKSLAIVYDVPYPFVLGGGQWRMFRIAKELVQQGWNVDWYCFLSWEGSHTRTHEGVKYIGVTAMPSLYSQRSSKRRIGAVVRYSVYLAKYSDRLAEYDAVWFGQWPILPLLAAAVSRLHRKTQIVVDWWEYWDAEWFRYAGKILGVVGWSLEKLAARYSTRHGTLISISATGHSELGKHYGFPSSLAMIPNGVDVSWENGLKSTQKCNFRIAYLGRLVPHKNVNHIIHAVADLNRIGNSVELDILGDGPELDRLSRLAKEKGVQEQIRFHGALCNEFATGVLRECSVFVHPSLKEGGGSLTVLEAFNAGLPVVCYDHKNGIDDYYVPDDVVGVRVNPCTSEALAQAIQELTLDQSKLEKLRLCIPSHIKTFSWPNVTKQYLKIFGVNSK